VGGELAAAGAGVVLAVAQDGAAAAADRSVELWLIERVELHHYSHDAHDIVSRPRPPQAGLFSAMDPERYRPLIEQMLPFPRRLERAVYRKKYQPVGHIAHGWLMRCVRGAYAVKTLHDSGMGGEASPVARSVVEHLVALRWLMTDGGTINSPLRTNHHEQTKRVLTALEVASSPAFDGEHFARVLASTEHDDHGRDHLQQFAHRAKLHATKQDMTVYFAEVMRSHATYQSAISYWDVENSSPREVSRDESALLKFSSCYMYQALTVYRGLFIARPWGGELRSIRAKLVEIDPLLDLALETVV
jgi:hypothetical protein